MIVPRRNHVTDIGEDLKVNFFLACKKPWDRTT